MRLRRLQIHNFRKLIGPVVIENIGDGMTVIAGDNEEGKSTVLQALRTVLFDRYNLTGDAAEAMLPFGHKVRPEIRLDFEISGSAYRLTKGFCQRPSAELVTRTGTLTGQAVEEKLQELLRFRSPSRGQSHPDEHHGICGFFWIEQGRAFDPISLSAENRGNLTGALEGEVGQVLGGARGRALKDAIRRAYSAFFTETGRLRGPLAEAAASVERLEGQIDPVKQQLIQYESKVDELARTRDRLALYERESRFIRAQTRFDQAQAAMNELASLRQNVEGATNSKAIADASVQGPAAAWRRREEAIARVQSTSDAAVFASTSFDTAEQRVSSVTQSLTTAIIEFEGAAAALATSAQKFQTVQRRVERIRLREEVDRLTRTFAETQSSTEAARLARAAAGAIKIDKPMLQRLRSLDRKRTEADAALAASSTLIRFQFERDGIVVVGGAAVPKIGEMLIADLTEVGIAKVGSLSIVPGGAELSLRREGAERAEHQLRDALQNAGAETIANAETLFGQRQAHEGNAENQDRVVAALCPQGIELLASQLADARAALERLPTEDATEEDSDLEVARAAYGTAEQNLSVARNRRDSLQSGLGAAREERARADATKSAAHSAAEEAAQNLATARQQASDEAIQQTVAAAGRSSALAASALEAAEAALNASDPEALQLMFEQARDGLALVKKDIEQLNRREDTLSVELRALGQQGLGEALQELEGRRELEVLKRDRLAREAAALKLLYETLNRMEQRAREAFLDPVQRRIQPYLRLLLPDTELVLSDADLGVTHVRRGGQQEPFASLSIGAREQIAVLTRLAFADLLRERGHIAPVVLDDALVNSDPRRFERMLLAIRRAARNLQIVVLTCHEADWVQAGATLIRLVDCNRETI